ncbi:MAG: hypothetical protein M0Z58_06350 [Nitrospiraceae bacterium]|nr:hypothetical protein [Nitrospiraceae bacterium]
MKPTFLHTPVNGPFEDPCVYVRLLREKKAFLLDMGNIDRLPSGLLSKVACAFVTHAHIDHFIGFDHLLRNMLGNTSALNIYGPSDIIEKVAGKLKGYSWNLIRQYPLRIEVFGISADEIRRTSFRAENAFEPVHGPALPFTGIALRETYYQVKAVVLKHDIDCIGWSIEEDFHINIDKAALLEENLPVGPWLTVFKQKIRSGRPADSAFTVTLPGGEKNFTLAELKAKIARITRGQKITYVMDSAPTGDNVGKIVDFAAGSDTLYIEAYFLDEDIERARQRNHLTAGIAGRIARDAGAGNLVIMHHSPKYRLAPEAIIKEASAAFGGPVIQARGTGRKPEVDF